MHNSKCLEWPPRWQGPDAKAGHAGGRIEKIDGLHLHIHGLYEHTGVRADCLIAKGRKADVLSLARRKESGSQPHLR